MALSEADKKEIRAIAQEETVNEMFAVLEFAESVDNYGDFRKGLRAIVEGTRDLNMDEAEINRLAAEQAPPEREVPTVVGENARSTGRAAKS